MAFVLSDRIKETTTTTGTGTYTLGGAVSGFETFTANLSNGDTTYYCCTDGTDFEVGLGTFTSSGTTLARTTIISSSNSNNAVNWSSGSRDIFCTLPGSKVLALDGSDDLTLVGANGNLVFDKSADALVFADDVEAVFGTGSDLRIFHDGTNNIFRGASRPMYIQTDNTIFLTKNAASETMAKFIGDGAVELYYNNEKNFETTINGAVIGNDVGILELNATNNTLGTTVAGVHLYGKSFRERGFSIFNDSLGESSLVEEWFIGVAYGDNNQPLVIKTNDQNETALKINQLGSVELYHNNSKKFETTSSGATVTGTLAATLSTAAQPNVTSLGTLTGLTTSGTISLSQTSGTAITTSGGLASADLGILRAHAGGDTHGFTIKYMGSRSGNNNSYSLFMDNQTGTDVEAMTVFQDGKVGINQTTPTASLHVGDTALFDDDVTFTGTSGNIVFDKSDDALEFADNVKAYFGTGNDFEIFDDGTVSRIQADRLLYLKGTGINFYKQNTSELMASMIQDGAVELYHNNVKKFETTANGFGYFTSDVTMEFSDQSNNGVVEIGGSAGALIDLKSPKGDDFDFRLQVNTSNTAFVISDDLHLQSKTGAEDYLDATVNGAVNLYYDNVKKFETTSDGATVTGNVTLSSTDAGSGDAPTLILKRDSSSPANFDNQGNIKFLGENDASEEIKYGEIQVQASNVADGSEESRMVFSIFNDGADKEMMFLDANQGGGVMYLTAGIDLMFEGTNANSNETTVTVTDPTADRTITLPDATGTVLTTGNSDTPTTTTSSSDADFVLVDDGGTMKKITPSNLGITSGGASKGFAVAMAIAL